MTQALFGRFLPSKTLISAAVAVLSLGFGIANAQPLSTGLSHQNGDAYNLVRGGGG